MLACEMTSGKVIPAEANPETAARFDELVDAFAALRDTAVPCGVPARPLHDDRDSTPWANACRSRAWSTRACSYQEISRRTGASTATVTRVAQWLHHGEGGYAAVLEASSTMTRRLTLALPSKGRLREPSWPLLEASGVSPQEPGERVLQAHCRNADIDLLFVRADDVPEYVQDGVVDCGITGLDLISRARVQRRGAPAPRLRCVLAAGGRLERRRRRQCIEDLEGRRIATSHPRIAAKALAERGVNAELVHGRRFGRDLAATRTRRRDHRPRLDRQHAAHQRAALDRHRSSSPRRCWSDEIEREGLRGSPDAHDGARFGNQRSGQSLPLVQRAKKRLDEVTALLPTSGSPTVMDLATPGVVAVHASRARGRDLVAVAQLEAAGASSILTLPVERMVP